MYTEQSADHLYAGRRRCWEASAYPTTVPASTATSHGIRGRARILRVSSASAGTDSSNEADVPVTMGA